MIKIKDAERQASLEEEDNFIFITRIMAGGCRALPKH